MNRSNAAHIGKTPTTHASPTTPSLASQHSVVRSPGHGAALADTTHHSKSYVYVAHSRRAGGLSLGIDLTPQGFCSFRCIYCQASHPPVRNPDISVDVATLVKDLRERLQAETGDLKDLVFAGSGEPTAVPNFAAAIDAVEQVCRAHNFDRPRRIFSNARHLHRDEVWTALDGWCERGGELWIKFDGATDNAVERVNGRRFSVSEHLQRVWRFASHRPIGLQTMLLRGPSLAPPQQMLEQLVQALTPAIRDGARIVQWHLLTISRRPADDQMARELAPVELDELQRLASDAAQATGLVVQVYPCAG